MRFEQYINEARITDTDDLASLIKKECKWFFKEKLTNKFLYRGTISIIDDYKKIIPRKKRMPKDTPIHIHNFMNKVFTKKFGWPGRNGVFATSKASVAGGHSPTVKAYLFFPVGKYKYIWSPKTDDFYMYVGREIPHEKKFFAPSMAEILAETYIDNNLPLAMEKGYEISFWCDAYYLVDLRYKKYFL